MSSGREFQRTYAATGNKRRPTVDRWNGGTCSRPSYDDDERSRRRPGRSATRGSLYLFLHLEAEKTERAVCAELQEVFRREDRDILRVARHLHDSAGAGVDCRSHCVYLRNRHDAVFDHRV